MLRMLKKIFKWSSVSLLVLLLLLAIAVYANWGRPNLRFEVSGKDVVVHLEALAEYPTSVDRIVIARSDRPDAPVFEAMSEDHAQIHRFKVHAGNNDLGILHPYKGTYQTLIPTGRSFVLLQDETYRFTVCEAGKCRSSRFTFR